MQLPKRIYPDNIREAVIEIKYISALPFEVLVGIFFNAFDNSFTYTNRPINQPAINPGIQAHLGEEITIKLGTSNLFYNEKISIQVSPNTFVFNCLNQYIGWTDYKPEIEKALKLLMATNHIQQCTRVGLRYISQYSETDLKDSIKFNFTFGLPDIQSETSAFRSEFPYHGTKVILNLNNNVPFIKQQLSTKQVELIQTSIIDIDVIADKLQIKSLEKLMDVIEDNHTKEKEIFFGMLNEDYLKSLNPQY